ncbi:MAG: type VI secretion system tube protein Hcp [Alphaproteobacteria bacterium]
MTHPCIRFLLPAGAIAAALAAFPARAADYFMMVEGLTPGVSLKAHAGWIRLSSVQEGVSATPSTVGAAGSASGKPRFESLIVTKPLDAASPILRKYVTAGQHIPHVQIDFVKGGLAQAYFTLDLKDVSFVSVQALATANEPTETIGLSFGEIKWSYATQKADGSLGAPVEATWNVRLNRP